MITPRLKIVCEGLNDVKLLRQIMGPELTAETRFYASQGRASLISLARNVIVHEGGPVLLVMDAESNSPNVKRELEAMTNAAMSGAASGGAFFANAGISKVFMFLPEIEVLFFEVPDALEHIIESPIDNEILEEGMIAPVATLIKLTGESKVSALDRVFENFDEQTIAMLRKGKQALAFRDAVVQLLRDSAAA